MGLLAAGAAKDAEAASGMDHVARTGRHRGGDPRGRRQGRQEEGPERAGARLPRRRWALHAWRATAPSRPGREPAVGCGTPCRKLKAACARK
eukprot:3140040-Pleurochrysis_carterae.AAC.2